MGEPVGSAVTTSIVMFVQVFSPRVTTSVKTTPSKEKPP